MRLTFARSLAVSLALAAMVLRALLPDGWMPAAGASPFVICSIDAKHGDGKAPGPAPRGHAPCAFAAAAPLSPPGIVARITAPPAQETRRAPRFAQDVTVAASAHRPNAARAPPAFS